MGSDSNLVIAGIFVAAGLACCAGSGAIGAITKLEVDPNYSAWLAVVPADGKCLRGRDAAGAPYVIAVPAKWNGVLVVHAHGGPELGEPREKRADEDAERWAVTVKAGYAWAASVFRGGVAVRSSGEDTERVRQIFVEK